MCAVSQEILAAFKITESAFASLEVMQGAENAYALSAADSRSIDVGSMRVAYRRHDAALGVDGIVPEGYTFFGFTSDRAGATRWNGLAMTADDVASTRGGTDVCALVPDSFYTITFRNSAPEHSSGSLTLELLRHVPIEPALVRSRYTSHLRASVRALLADRLPPARHSKTAIADNLVRLLAFIVGNGGETVELSRGQSRRIAAVRACQEHFDSHIGERVTLPELSEVCGLRPRSLTNAFEAVTGTSPMAYLRARRLRRVRYALESARKEAKIIDIAADSGFWHMGHFAAAYRAMFGETPSQTLLNAKRYAGLLAQDDGN